MHHVNSYESLCYISLCRIKKKRRTDPSRVPLFKTILRISKLSFPQAPPIPRPLSSPMSAPCLPAPDACRKAFTVLVLWESFSSTGRKAAYSPAMPAVKRPIFPPL